MREGQMVTQMQGREMIRAKERANEIAQQHLDLLRMQFFMGQNGQHSADSEEVSAKNGLGGGEMGQTVGMVIIALLNLIDHQIHLLNLWHQ